MQLGGQVLDVLVEQPAVVALVQVPGLGGQVIDDLLLDPGDIAPWGAQEGHDVVLPQAVRRVGDAGEAGDQQQLGNVLGIGAAELGVDLLGD